MSQTRLERDTELGQGQLSMFFRRNSDNMQPARLQRVAERLGVRYEWLATGKGEMVAIESPDVAPNDHLRLARDTAIASGADSEVADEVIAEISKGQDSWTPAELANFIVAETKRRKRAPADGPVRGTVITSETAKERMPSIEEVAKRRAGKKAKRR